MSRNLFVMLTPFRRGILQLAETETTISASDVARDQVRGGNKRAAIKQLAWLKDAGFLRPVRSCEFMLTEQGQAWLDANRAPADGATEEE